MYRKFYIAVIIILFLIVIVCAEIFLGSNSIPRQNQVKKEIVTYQNQIDSLEKVIENYKKEIELLENDSLYKEKILRTHYGMSQKGEKVFQLVE